MSLCNQFLSALALITLIACGGTETTTTSSSSSSSCTLTENTTTQSTNSNGCKLVSRDTSSCQSDRTAQGLSGFWLKFSCRVTLTVSGGNVIITADSKPDTKSGYFASSDACYEEITATGRSANPNTIAEQNISMTVSLSPASTGGAVLSLGTIGIAVNGTSIYSNAAAPGDDIYDEVATFDNCDGHPDSSSTYHYHIEPGAISQSDNTFIGIMRDGNPVYGRYDSGSTLTSALDANGGHTGVSPDGDNVYHYHVNLQTSGGDSAYFITKDNMAGPVGACTGC